MARYTRNAMKRRAETTESAIFVLASPMPPPPRSVCVMSKGSGIQELSERCEVHCIPYTSCQGKEQRKDNILQRKGATSGTRHHMEYANHEAMHHHHMTNPSMCFDPAHKQACNLITVESNVPPRCLLTRRPRSSTVQCMGSWQMQWPPRIGRTPHLSVPARSSSHCGQQQAHPIQPRS